MEIITRKLSEITPYEKNPRKNDGSVDKVAESIKEFGFKVPIVVDKNGVIVAGHTRYKAAKKLRLASVPCIVADDLNDAQVRAFRLADNKVGEGSKWDVDLLAEELADVLDIDMGNFGFTDIDFAGLDEYAKMDREFQQNMKNADDQTADEDYDEFLKKFELKKTTDDCYTPQNIYECVRKWATERFNLEGRKVLRPFYPGGDYQRETYEEGCVVIDNPPFSILSEICAWYDEQGIDYFLFAPSLMLFSTYSGKCNYIVAGTQVVYENGAVVSTGYVTNLGDMKVVVAPDLREMAEAENYKNMQEGKTELPKYDYPPHVITSARLNYLAVHGVPLEIAKESASFIRALDSQKEADKVIFGGGFIISDKAASEKTSAEVLAESNATKETNGESMHMVWELSDRERAIIAKLK